MSVARTEFCDRIATVRAAVVEFKLQDFPTTAANALHNKSARMIRNGLAVQCFNVFEDFVKRRANEVLESIGASAVPFSYWPDRLQRAVTVDIVKAIDFQLRLRDQDDRIRFVQEYSEKISSTKLMPVQNTDIAFFHSSSNISKDHYRNALAAFAVEKPWPQVSGLCSRLGLSGIPSENLFYSFAQMRHRAAHDSNASVSEVDIKQSLVDATSLSICFDILVSKCAGLVTRTTARTTASVALISDQSVIPLRFIRYARGKFGEIREEGKRFVRCDSNSAKLIANALRRSVVENGALIICDESGTIVNWIV